MLLEMLKDKFGFDILPGGLWIGAIDFTKQPILQNTFSTATHILYISDAFQALQLQNLIGHFQNDTI